MSAPYITRRSIHATEEEREVGAVRGHWTAELNGYLSSGEHVTMSRGGETFAAAVKALENAIAENGWTIKEKGTRE